MKKIIGSVIMLVLSSAAMADLTLAGNGKNVVCSGEDNQSWVINAARTAIKYTVEGQSSAPQWVVKRSTDGRDYIFFTTSEGTLSFGNRGDFYQFAGDRKAQRVRCK